MYFTLTLFVLLGTACNTYGDGDEMKAKCVIDPTTGSTNEKISGTVEFSEKKGASEELKIEITLKGFNTTDNNTKHGFHVHTEPKLSNGCVDAKGHYNPANKAHGAPGDAIRHVGDFGNIVEDKNGEVKSTKMDRIASLYDNKANKYSILNRTIVVHAMIDDLGKGGALSSNTTGNAGKRVGCCLIMEDKDTSSTVRILPCVYLILATIIFSFSKYVV